MQVRPTPIRTSQDQQTGSQNNRTRASMACLECRTRKIRCDLSVKRAICTNCETNERSCSTKRRTRRPRYEIPVEKYQRLGQFDHRPQEASLDTCSQTPMEDVASARPVVDEWPKPVSSNMDLNGWMWNDPHVAPNKLMQSDGMKSSEAQCDKSQKGTHDFKLLTNIYPSITRSSISSLREDDVDFLHCRHCFQLPSADLLKKLMTEFFSRVHPQLPILDQEEFLSLLNNNLHSSGPRPRISLLVLHSMIHVACSVRSLE